jgi:hypothetical protein
MKRRCLAIPFLLLLPSGKDKLQAHHGKPTLRLPLPEGK